MSIRVCAVVALALIAGAGCGRRGSLEDPGAAANEPASTAPGDTDDASPGAQEPAAMRPAETAPQRRFVLDPLI